MKTCVSLMKVVTSIKELNLALEFLLLLKLKELVCIYRTLLDQLELRGILVLLKCFSKTD